MIRIPCRYVLLSVRCDADHCALFCRTSTATGNRARILGWSPTSLHRDRNGACRIGRIAVFHLLWNLAYAPQWLDEHLDYWCRHSSLGINCLDCRCSSPALVVPLRRGGCSPANPLAHLLTSTPQHLVRRRVLQV